MTPKRGVTLRAVLIGIAFIPLNVYLVVQLETVWNLGDPTTMTIFFNAIFCLFLVIGTNRLLIRWLPKNALNQGELLTIYSILMVSISVSGQDFTHTIFGTLGNARWFATPENEWTTLFLRYVPQWLEPSEKVLEPYFSGESSFYVSTRIKGWIQPLVWWTLFLTVLCFVMICINSIIRRQWIEQERLTYPLVDLPFEMTRVNFFKNRLLWLGFGIAVSISLFNGLNALFPVLPKIPLSYNLTTHLVERPWDTLRGMAGCTNPSEPVYHWTHLFDSARFALFLLVLLFYMEAAIHTRKSDGHKCTTLPVCESAGTGWLFRYCCCNVMAREKASMARAESSSRSRTGCWRYQ